MLRIDIKLPLKFTENDIKSKICFVFPVAKEDIKHFEILKLALDLTDKANICYKAAIGVLFESELEEKFKTVKGGKGIAYTVPMTSTIGVAIYQFLSNTTSGGLI